MLSLEDENIYVVSIDEVDSLIYKYFNKKNIRLDNIKTGYSTTTITKEGSNYKIEWTPIVGGGDSYETPTVTYDGEFVRVRYSIVHWVCEDEACCEDNSDYAIFHLKYNNGNYNLIKIEEKNQHC